MSRSSCLELVQRTEVLKISDTCAGVSFSIKLPECNFLKERLRQRHFPINFSKFSRTLHLWNIWEWLLLYVKLYVVSAATRSKKEWFLHINGNAKHLQNTTSGVVVFFNWIFLKLRIVVISSSWWMCSMIVFFECVPW